MAKKYNKTIFRSIPSGFPKPRHQGKKGWFAIIKPGGTTRYATLKQRKKK